MASQSGVCQRGKARTLISSLPICLFSVSLSFFLSPIAFPYSHVCLTSPSLPSCHCLSPSSYLSTYISLLPLCSVCFPLPLLPIPVCLILSLLTDEDASGSGEGQHYADDWMAGAAAVGPPARPPRPPGRKGGFITRQNQGRSRTGGASVGFHTQPILILFLSALVLLGPR